MMTSARETAFDVDRLSFHVGIDDDDPDLPGYLEIDIMDGLAKITVLPNKGSGPATCNAVALGIEADLILNAADDVLFRTPGWDDALDAAYDALPDGMALMYFNDGRDRDKCEHFVVPRRWVQAVGHLLRPDYEHFSADEDAQEIAKAVGRYIWLKDIVLEHMHFKYGKADKDETYAMKRREAVTDRDHARFNAFAPFRRQEIARLQAVIGGPLE